MTKHLPKLILFLLLLPVLQTQTPVFANSPPVLAFYYAWFDENTWTSGLPADYPAHPYRSANPATIERQVTQAQNAGINAFVQSWYGPQTENNQTETNFSALLNIAARHNFGAAVDVEVTGPFFPNAASVQNALATLMATHVQHSAYLRYRGKPVIFFWRQQRFDTATWAAIRQAVDPNHTTWWIAEGLDPDYLEVFDGLHLYSIAWAGNPAAELSKWPPRIQKVENRLGVDKLWAATVMPGYNDLNLNRADSFVRPRNNGNFYRQTWAAARATEPDMLIITSFNEWLEGTQIETSATYGNFYLDLTRQLVNESKAAPPENGSAAKLPAQPVAAQPEPPAAKTKRSLNANGSYTIQPGDTLYAIAFAFDVPLKSILQANNITANDTLLVGQSLLIPAVKDNALPRKIFPFSQERNIPLDFR